MSIPVNEIFETVQGEATWAGTPAVFVRLQGCPVGCPWCDTRHTWHRDITRELSLAAVQTKGAEPSDRWAGVSVLDLVLVIRGYRARHVVITGGEPCMEDLRPLSAALLRGGRAVQVETSGTHEIRVDDHAWVTVSPKIHMPGGLDVRADAMLRADEIKHPVGKMADVDRLDALLSEKPTRTGVQVWLQPLSLSEKATRLCVEVATDRGWRVSVQTHKMMGVR